MEQFFTWATLGTYAGATMATALITQIIKEIGPIGRLPTRLVSYAVALLVLVAAVLFSGKATIGSIALCFLNAAVVALASNGAFDALTKKRGSQ